MHESYIKHQNAESEFSIAYIDFIQSLLIWCGMIEGLDCGCNREHILSFFSVSFSPLGLKTCVMNLCGINSHNKTCMLREGKHLNWLA